MRTHVALHCGDRVGMWSVFVPRHVISNNVVFLSSVDSD